VREFVLLAARELGLSMRFQGEGADEVGIVTAIADPEKAPALRVGDVILRVDPRYLRPAEVRTLLGDASKARDQLGWTPEVTLEEMVAEMVQHDLAQARRRALLKRHGFEQPVEVE
jgi:GDPmannose 4,6-dehydratase